MITIERANGLQEPEKDLDIPTEFIRLPFAHRLRIESLSKVFVIEAECSLDINKIEYEIPRNKTFWQGVFSTYYSYLQKINIRNAIKYVIIRKAVPEAILVPLPNYWECDHLKYPRKSGTAVCDYISYREIQEDEAFEYYEKNK